MINHALALVRAGFRVFPVREGQKKPPVFTGFEEAASTDATVIRQWWATGPHNIGVSTRDLLLLDIDALKGGYLTILEWELEGKILPPTWTQVTPGGGRHHSFISPHPVPCSVEKVGKGVDIRGTGGYFVGPGSRTEEGEYRLIDARAPVLAPAWLVEMAGVVTERVLQSPLLQSLPSALQRAIDLCEVTPGARQGNKGDDATYKLATRIKDFGLTADDALQVILDRWNPKCLPPWDPQEMRLKVRNAYSYGKDAPGSHAPERDFKRIESPAGELITDSQEHPAGFAPGWVDEMNKEYALVTSGGSTHILWETTDVDGKYRLEHMGTSDFILRLAPYVIQIGKGSRSKGELWLKARGRREYDGICFAPGKVVPANWFNLWRGFSVEPLLVGETPSPVAVEAVRKFDEHLTLNICGGGLPALKYLIGFLAHLVQFPGCKPLVALVFRGKEGTGKTSVANITGAMMQDHYTLVANPRFLTGNFNAHLENCEVVCFDEAFWSGDKAQVGVLNDLITGGTHFIERKGVEVYKVKNCLRVFIIGNAEWVVPASADARRYAVFDVGDGRILDLDFFHDMRVGMEQGGYRLLLRRLLDYDLTGFKINDPPRTKGLLNQKLESLEPVHQWWMDALVDGRLPYSDSTAQGWNDHIEKERVRSSLARYLKDRNIRSRVPDNRAITKAIRGACPSVIDKPVAIPKQYGGGVTPGYWFPTLPVCRQEWEKFIGHKVEWEGF